MNLQTFTDSDIEYTYYINAENKVCLGTNSNTQSSISYGTEGILHVPGIFYKNGIKNTITILSKYSFLRVKVTEIYLPSTIRYIYHGSFEQMPSIRFIDLSKTKIDLLNGYVFSSCLKIETVLFPPTIKSIGQCAFKACTLIKELVLPSSLKQIDNLTFKNAVIKKLIYCGNKDIKGIFDATIETVIVPNSFEDESLGGISQLKRQTYYCDFFETRRRTLCRNTKTFSNLLFVMTCIIC